MVKFIKDNFNCKFKQEFSEKRKLEKNHLLGSLNNNINNMLLKRKNRIEKNT